MDGNKYLFIDGGYVRQIYRAAMKTVFGADGELSVRRIVDYANTFRTYYYDCLDETQKDGESSAEFAARVAAQQAYHSQLRSLPAVHVQLGQLKGVRPRRQKEVDVLLAVDMLTHGFNRNMARAILLSGDLDFRPVVEALVRGGVFVEVWYEKTTGSEELYGAADLGQRLDWNILYSWSTDAFIAGHPQPKRTGSAGNEYLTALQIGSGTFAGGQVELLSCGDRGPFVLHVLMPGGNNDWFKHPDRKGLLGYFSAIHGPINWKFLREQ
jgi:hypothetical protein